VDFNGIQEGGLNRILGARLNTELANPAPVLTPEIGAGLVLESERPEWGWLKGERHGGAVITIAGVAAQFTQFAVVNPVGSRLLAVVTGFGGNLPSAQAVSWGVGLGPIAGLATVNTTTSRDTRWMQDPATTGGMHCLVRSGTTAAVVQRAIGRTTFGTGHLALYQPCVVSPGYHFVVAILTANIAWTQGFVEWYERPALPNELVV